jgi:hypothetical protein
MVVTNKHKLTAATRDRDQRHRLSGLTGLINQDVRETFLLEYRRASASARHQHGIGGGELPLGGSGIPSAHIADEALQRFPDGSCFCNASDTDPHLVKAVSEVVNSSV